MLRAISVASSAGVMSVPSERVILVAAIGGATSLQFYP